MSDQTRLVTSKPPGYGVDIRTARGTPSAALVVSPKSRRRGFALVRVAVAGIALTCCGPTSSGSDPAGFGGSSSYRGDRNEGAGTGATAAGSGSQPAVNTGGIPAKGANSGGAAPVSSGGAGLGAGTGVVARGGDASQGGNSTTQIGGSVGTRPASDGGIGATFGGMPGVSGSGGNGHSNAGGLASDAGTTAAGRPGAPAGGATGDFGGRGGVSGAAGIGASVWQLDPDKPLASNVPAFPQAGHSLKPTTLWDSSLGTPRPTNVFWMNLVLGQGTLRINVYPYQVKALSSGLSVACPRTIVTDTSVTTPDETHVMIGSAESLDAHQVTAYDDLSVTVTWKVGQGSLVTPLVYGMPYATGLYQALTPVIRVPSAAILSVNGATTSPVTARQLQVQLNNNQVWNLYASSSLVWTWTTSEIRASEALSNGWVRVALVPDVGAASVLDTYATAIPVGGVVDLSRNAEIAKVKFDWQRTGSGNLLMMALPHHVPRLVLPHSLGLTHSTVSGIMTAIAGESWLLEYPLSSIDWRAPRNIGADVKSEIQSALQAESGYVPAAQDDPYFGGKQLAKLGRLLLIAKELGQSELVDAFLNRLRAAVSSWLDGNNPNPFVYETTWGGVVTSRGLADSGADFGQGYYNDHHFHYGYHLYAAAVVAAEDPVWAASYSDKMLWLARDIANPSSVDPYFPRFRNFDWYVGHSWASGLFEFGDNRNQESTSEAVNAWYATELVGRALGHETLTNLGRILRAVETASAQTYWQLTDASDIYAAPFKNHHGVGVLWSTKVDFATFFGSNPEYIYGIQMLPFTPATEDLLQTSWVHDAWAQMSAASTAATEQSWQGFIAMAHAVIARQAALTEVRALTDFDNGNSRANALYWVGTRP